MARRALDAQLATSASRHVVVRRIPPLGGLTSLLISVRGYARPSGTGPIRRRLLCGHMRDDAGVNRGPEPALDLVTCETQLARVRTCPHSRLRPPSRLGGAAARGTSAALAESLGALLRAPQKDNVCVPAPTEDQVTCTGREIGHLALGRRCPAVLRPSTDQLTVIGEEEARGWSAWSNGLSAARVLDGDARLSRRASAEPRSLASMPVRARVSVMTSRLWGPDGRSHTTWPRRVHLAMVCAIIVP